MIRTIGFLIMVSITSSLAGGVQQPNVPSDAERRQAAYAIYSTLMSNPPTSYGSDASAANKVYAIEATTSSPMPGEAVGTPPCVVPPTQYADRWNEVLADFTARKDPPVNLERSLNIPKSYVYLKPEEVSGFKASRQSDTRLDGVRDVFSLSDVYFSKNLTLAATGIRSWCGSRCGLGLWKIYEKTSDGSWKEVRTGRICVWQA